MFTCTYCASTYLHHDQVLAPGHDVHRFRCKHQRQCKDYEHIVHMYYLRDNICREIKIISG